MLRRRHRAHRRASSPAARIRRRSPHRRRRVDDDAQDAARPARRHADVQGARTRRRSTARCSPACRAARTTTRPPASRSRCSEAATDAFKTYAHQIVANAQALAAALVERGFTLVTGGTDNHLILADLTKQERARQDRREGARRAPASSSTTTRAVRSAQAVRSVGHPPRHAGGDVARHGRAGDEADRGVDGRRSSPRRPTRPLHAQIAGEVRELCAKFPAPGILV